jgi:hypothetical protein
LVRASRAAGDGLSRRGIARSRGALDNCAKLRIPRDGTPSALGLSRETQTNSYQEESQKTMNTATMFESINIDQLNDVTGGFDWGQFGRATGGGAVAGAAGGAVAGAITGSAAGGVGALPGAGIGAAAGGVGGAVTSGINNIGQQFGWWN